MEIQEIIVHGISENGELSVKKGHGMIENGNTVCENFSKPYSPADIKNMDGFDDTSKAIVEAIQGLKPEYTTIDENDVRKIISFRRRTRASAVEVTRVERYWKISDGKFMGIRNANTQSFDPGDSPVLCDAVSRAFIETVHTPEVIEAYQAKLAAQAEATP